MSAKSPTPSDEFPSYATDIPANAREFPVVAVDIPIDAADIPANAREFPNNASDIRAGSIVGVCRQILQGCAMVLIALAPCVPLSRRAGEGERQGEPPFAHTPLSHPVGEGLGVRATKKRTHPARSEPTRLVLRRPLRHRPHRLNDCAGVDAVRLQQGVGLA